jgi:hypothetical protein
MVAKYIKMHAARRGGCGCRCRYRGGGDRPDSVFRVRVEAPDVGLQGTFVCSGLRLSKNIFL